MATSLISGILAAALFVVTVCVLLSRERSARSRAALKRLEEAKPERRPVGRATFADFSAFNQDQLLRNRSERWD